MSFSKLFIYVMKTRVIRRNNIYCISIEKFMNIYLNLIGNILKKEWTRILVNEHN